MKNNLAEAERVEKLNRACGRRTQMLNQAREKLSLVKEKLKMTGAKLKAHLDDLIGLKNKMASRREPATDQEKQQLESTANQVAADRRVMDELRAEMAEVHKWRIASQDALDEEIRAHGGKLNMPNAEASES